MKTFLRMLTYSFGFLFITLYTTNMVSAMPLHSDGCGTYEYYPGTSAQTMPGDIIFTYASGNSLADHVGIVSPSGANIVHAPGKNELLDSMDFEEWTHKYHASQVLRYPDRNLAANAGMWASDFVRDNPNVPYSLATTSLKNLSSMYCSKLVWNAYYHSGVDLFPDVFSHELLHPIRFVSSPRLRDVCSFGRNN